MRNIILLFLTFLLIASSKAQTFEWIKGRDINYSMNPGSLNFSVTTDSQGNIWFSGLKEFVQSYQSAMGNLFLSRYNSAGELLDDYEISGSALLSDLTTDDIGNVYLIGQYITDLDFWDGTQLAFSGPFINGFLLKVNNGGSIDWVKDLSQLFPDAVPEDLTFRNGFLYLAHSSWLSSNVSVFDTGGDLVKDIEQLSVGIASSVAVDSDGNIFVAGSCPDAGSQFGGISFPAPFSYSIYLVKYSAEGLPLWVQFMEDITCISPYLDIRNDGMVMMGGILNIQTTLDTLTFNGPSWVYDIFLSCFDQEGHIQWGFEVPQVMTGDASPGETRPFIVNQDHSVTLTGLLRGSVDWDNGVVSQGTIGAYESLLLHISSTGQAVWTKSSSSSSYSYGLAIASGADQNLYVTGIGHGELSFDTCTYTNPSYYYPYLAKLNTV
ncbi:MAG: hypothetical protein IPH84_05940 [Bacteroidales bacterium]|nr:hypothetical protein [Bacteroidales bacterium]